MSILETGKVLTGNRLADGAAVFMTRSGEWSRSIDDAVVALEPQSQAALQKRGGEAVTRNVVSEAWLIAVDRCQGRVEPRDVRERVRAGAPRAQRLAPCLSLQQG